MIDFRFAIKSLLRSPAFTIIAVVNVSACSKGKAPIATRG